MKTVYYKYYTYLFSSGLIKLKCLKYEILRNKLSKNVLSYVAKLVFVYNNEQTFMIT